MNTQKTPDHDYSAHIHPSPGDNLLAQIRAEAQSLLDAQAEVARIEADLKQAEAVVTHLESKVLPDLMETAGMSIVTTTDGVVVEIKPVLRASMPKDDPDPALNYLEKENYGDVIKRTITISFNRGEEKWAAKFVRDLTQRKKPVRAVMALKVEPQTLLATLRELLAAGKNVPMAAFQATRQPTAFITLPGQEKKPKRSKKKEEAE